MTDVTRDMLIDYMRRKGGRVKNVDLVKHFRKYLLFEDAIKKGLLLLVLQYMCRGLHRAGTVLLYLFE